MTDRCQCGACDLTPHASSCAVHNEPALHNEPCDCGIEGWPPSAWAYFILVGMLAVWTALEAFICIKEALP